MLGQWSGRFRFFRLDLIDSVKSGKSVEEAPTDSLQAFQSKVWGVATTAELATEHIELVIHAEPEEGYVVQRLHREKRCGTVTELGGGNWRFEADVFDAVELPPWIRTFTGRIVSLKSTNAEVEKRFYGDLAALRAMYGGDADAVQ